MSVEQPDPTITPPPPGTPAESEIITGQAQVHFSGVRWVTTGVVRLLYRSWTRMAVRVFPEDSAAEEFARKLHIPLPDQLNMSWVTDHLAVGGRVHPQDVPALALTGITHVIDTRAEYHDDPEIMRKKQIELLCLPTPDTYPLTVEQLIEGASWASDRMKKGGRVLIHCEHGVGRSVLLTCAVLVYDGMRANKALELIQEKRWQAAPNHRQIARLREFERALVDRRKA